MATEINIKKLNFNNTDDENSEGIFSSEQDENSQVNEEFGFRSQSFTFLMADRQDINRVSSFSRCFNGTFP